MKYVPLSDHRHFFTQNGFIAFDALIPAFRREKIFHAFDHALSKRLKKPGAELFMHGRDLWRDDPSLKSWVLNREFAGIASFLTLEKRLQIGYDQLLRTLEHAPLEKAALETFRLDQVSSLQGIACGLILRLKGNGIINSFLPNEEGGAVFFQPDLFFSLAPLWETPDQSFLLITYTKEKSVYIFQKEDPHTHLLKKHGYVFGDALKSSLHPYVYRS